MQKRICIILLLVFACGICSAKVVRLGVISANPRNLEKMIFLIDHHYIDLDSIEIVCIHHQSQRQLIESTEEFILNNGRADVSRITINHSISMDSLFALNQCSKEFEKIFQQTDGLIFLEGADISPKLYEEKTFLTTDLIANERNWELSFLFHLLGGNQNANFVPLLEQKPDYLILGICLGMQEMNVATGGTLFQDIPFQIYKKKDYESVLGQDSEKQHKNYQSRIINDKKAILHFHHIRITPNSMLDFGITAKPLVASVHHQSVKKPGENFQVMARSMDKKVVEAIYHSKYRNVYGIQFHTEFPVLYEQQEFMNAKNEMVSLDENDQLFHRLFWKDFSKRLD